MAKREMIQPGPRRPGRPPNSDGLATRERLLDVALELFARQGFAATTVRQIGAAAGVSDSGIYGHFPGKQAVYDALFAAAGPVGGDPLRVDVDAMLAAGPRDAIAALVDDAWEQWSSARSCQFLSVLLRDGSGAGGLSGLNAAVEATRDQLQVPFQRWQDDGKMRADVPARQLVWELFAPLQVPRILYLRFDVTDADLAAARRMVDDHLAYFLTCVQPTGRM